MRAFWADVPRETDDRHVTRIDTISSSALRRQSIIALPKKFCGGMSAIVSLASRDDSHCTICIVEANGVCTKIHSKQTALMSSVIKKFEEHKKVTPGTHRFLVDGETLPTGIDSDETVGDYAFDACESGEIEVMCLLEQVGGGMM